MIPKPSRVLGGIHRPDRLARKYHLAASLFDAAAQLIIVGVHVGNGFEAADLADQLLGRRNRRAQRKFHSLHPLRDQYASEKIAGRTDSLQFRAEALFRDTS